MTYFAFIENGKINGCGECRQLTKGVLNLEIEKGVFDNLEKYIFDGEKIILNPDLDKIELQNLKEEKIKENDLKRDEKLNGGVLYKDILFDSDTDQKVNLLATVSTMEDEATITWFGMNNEALIANRADLLSIGALITKLHSFCWAKNAEIKGMINAAQTVEEVNGIEINYEETEEE